MQDYILTEIIARQKLAELDRRRDELAAAADAGVDAGASPRAAIASALVRLCMRIDTAATTRTMRLLASPRSQEA